MFIFEFFADLFGYVLQLLYNLVNNYGLAIILFTVIMKLALLPLSIKQHKTMKITTKLQKKVKVIQEKYKNNPEKLNQEVMELYKKENMSPFSGCLPAIIQLVLVLSIFYMVRSPITHMVKLPEEDISKYITEIENAQKVSNDYYKEIDLIREREYLKEKFPEDANIDKLDIEMNFLGLDLNKVPQQNMTDITVYIIPILYIISSFISIRLTTALQHKRKEESNKAIVVDKDTGKVEEEVDTLAQTNKMMSWMMPIMSISIAFIAPLGLALYWLMNNILMIIERLVLNKVIKTEEE